MKVIPLALAAFLALPVLAAEPPAATLSQLEKALERTEPEKVGHPVKVKTRAVVEKPNGKEREEYVTEALPKGDGTYRTTLLLAMKDGKDVTAEERAKAEKREAERKAKPAPSGAKGNANGEAKGEKKGTKGLGLKVPTGEDRKLFTISEPRSEGSLLVASYEPVKGAKGDDLSRGRIAWNPATGEPAFFEAQLVDPPTGLKELRMRGDFAGAGDAIYTSVLRTTGVGGVLWIKRRFEVTVEMTPLSAP